MIKNYFHGIYYNFQNHNMILTSYLCKILGLVHDDSYCTETATSTTCVVVAEKC